MTAMPGEPQMSDNPDTNAAEDAGRQAAEFSENMIKVAEKSQRLVSDWL